MNNTPTEQSNAYWGLMPTVLLGALIFIVFAVVQTFALIAYVYLIDAEAAQALSNPDSSLAMGQILDKYFVNGDAVAVAEIPAAFIGVAMVIFFIYLRKTISIDEYLSLRFPPIKTMLFYLALIVVAMIIMEVLNLVLDRPTPEFMIQLYSNTENIALLWIAVAVAAPFFEEFLFRGFLLEGMARSPVGVGASIVITSAAWAIIHMQYGWFEIISIFFIGILLGIAKVKTNSLYVPIAMHILMNLAASIGMELTL